jgi:hypothetical protein
VRERHREKEGQREEGAARKRARGEESRGRMKGSEIAMSPETRRRSCRFFTFSMIFSLIFFFMSSFLNMFPLPFFFVANSSSLFFISL